MTSNCSTRLAPLAVVLALATCAAAPQSSSTSFTLTSPGRADNEMPSQAFGGRNSANPNCGGDNL
jgi:hypothetical protein